MISTALLVALSYLAFGQLVDRRKTLLVNVIGSLMMNIYYMSVRQLHLVYEPVLHADRFDKPVYFHNTFDPRWMWLNGLFNFIGGGELVFYVLLQALIAESIPQSSLYVLFSATPFRLWILIPIFSLTGVLSTSILPPPR
jgi:hypothetical protein